MFKKFRKSNRRYRLDVNFFCLLSPGCFDKKLGCTTTTIFKVIRDQNVIFKVIRGKKKTSWRVNCSSSSLDSEQEESEAVMTVRGKNMVGSITSSAIFVFCLSVMTGTQLQKAFSEDAIQQFCDTETFRANCSDSEVILLASARYGRMETGRCVETPMGHIGCFRDVLPLADRRCSGKRICEIHVPNAEFESTRPCLRELKSYLEIGFVCIPVANLTSSYCQQRTELEVPSLPSGFLASVVTSDTPRCAGLPWVIEAERGQRINITVYDFTIDTRRTSSLLSSAGSDDGGSTSCREYAVVEDGNRRFPVCGGTGNKRVRETYTSSANVIKIWMTAGVAPTDHHRFLVYYAVFGCPDPLVPDATWFRRTPDGHAVAGCKTSDQSWIVRCRDYVWTTSASEHRNCSLGQTEERRLQADPGDDGSQHVDNITVAFALLAVTMVTIMLLTSAVCLISRRRKRRMKKTMQEDSLSDKPNRKSNTFIDSAANPGAGVPSLSLTVTQSIASCDRYFDGTDDENAKFIPVTTNLSAPLGFHNDHRSTKEGSVAEAFC